MARWTRHNQPPRRSYLKRLVGKPQHTGVDKGRMSEYYGRTQSFNPTHAMAFNPKAMKYADEFIKEFESVRAKIEQRIALMFNKMNVNYTIKERVFCVELQRSKHFRLNMFWVTGQNSYFFIKYEDFKSLLSISKPYGTREDAMYNYENNVIFWLDYIQIPIR